MIKYLLCVFAVLTFGDCQQCDDGYTLIRGKCFLPYNYVKASWNEAQQLCSIDNAALANINDCDLYGDLVRFFHVSGYESDIGYWIGATDMQKEGEWQWTNGNSLLLNVPYWGVKDGVDEPSGGISENCAMLYTEDHYYFHDDDCDFNFNFLCQKEPLVEKMNLVEYSEGVNEDEDLEIEDQTPKSFNCSNGFIPIRDSCFYFQTEFKVSWPEAVQFCQSISSKLAVLKDCGSFYYVSTYISDNVEYLGKNYWIGATDEGEEGVWAWTDFSPVILGTPFWGAIGLYQGPNRSPDDNCAYMQDTIQQHRFLDGSCDSPLYPLCQQDPI